VRIKLVLGRVRDGRLISMRWLLARVLRCIAQAFGHLAGRPVGGETTSRLWQSFPRRHAGPPGGPALWIRACFVWFRTCSKASVHPSLLCNLENPWDVSFMSPQLNAPSWRAACAPVSPCTRLSGPGVKTLSGNNMASHGSIVLGILVHPCLFLTILGEPEPHILRLHGSLHSKR